MKKLSCISICPIGKWAEDMFDNLGLNWFTKSFGDFFNSCNTVNLLDNMALLNWDRGVYHFGVVNTVFSSYCMARSCVGFFMGNNSFGNSYGWGNSR